MPTFRDPPPSSRGRLCLHVDTSCLVRRYAAAKTVPAEPYKAAVHMLSQINTWQALRKKVLQEKAAKGKAAGAAQWPLSATNLKFKLVIAACSERSMIIATLPWVCPANKVMQASLPCAQASLLMITSASI